MDLSIMSQDKQYFHNIIYSTVQRGQQALISEYINLFLKLWKLMLSILTCFLWVGLAFVGFGDDVMIGASELNDVALKDGELMLDPDVDGIDASLMLSTNKGLVDIFTDE
jgi:hypothetical protein